MTTSQEGIQQVNDRQGVLSSSAFPTPAVPLCLTSHAPPSPPASKTGAQLSFLFSGWNLITVSNI